MYCVMWMLEVCYFRNGSYLSPQTWPSVSSGYVPFSGRTETKISYYSGLTIGLQSKIDIFTWKQTGGSLQSRRQ